MNTIIKHFGKVVVFAFFFLSFSFMVNAQKIDDNDIKKNVTTIDNPLERIVQLQPQVFEYDKTRIKGLKLPSGKQYGFVTESLQASFPDLVTYKSYNYQVGKNTYRTAKVVETDVERLIPVLVASIKEQQAEIEKLKSEIQELKNKNSSASR